MSCIVSITLFPVWPFAIFTWRAFAPASNMQQWLGVPWAMVMQLDLRVSSVAQLDLFPVCHAHQTHRMIFSSLEPGSAASVHVDVAFWAASPRSACIIVFQLTSGTIFHPGLMQKSQPAVSHYGTVQTFAFLVQENRLWGSFLCTCLFQNGIRFQLLFLWAPLLLLLPFWRILFLSSPGPQLDFPSSPFLWFFLPCYLVCGSWY